MSGLATWINYYRAVDRLKPEVPSDRGGAPIGVDCEPFLIEALREGEVRSRILNYDTGTVRELHPEWWIDGLKRKELHYQTIDSGHIEVHRVDLHHWINPPPRKGSASGGRPPEHDWEAFWIEVARVANTPDGLPSTQSSLVDYIDGWFETEVGKAPARSSIEEKVSKLYKLLHTRK